MKVLYFCFAIAFSIINISYCKKYYAYYPNVDLYYKFHDEFLTWIEARNACVSEGATLAMPKTKDEANELMKIFSIDAPHMSLKTLADDYIFLGFHDIFTEGEYITLKGKSIQYFFHTWSPGQPDNFVNEDCGSLYRDGKLNDITCSTPLNFICQKTAKPLANDCPTTDLAYQEVQGVKKCYKIHLNPRVWADARTICEAEGGHLAIIRNKAEETALRAILNDPNNVVPQVKYDQALIGFHDMFREGEFLTVLDEDLNSIGYVNWLPNQPTGGTAQNCGSLAKTGQLNDFPCNISAVFLCEISIKK